MNKVLENLEAVRRELGIKQEVIANGLGVTQQTYSSYFTATGDMKITRIQEICDIMGVTLIDVITYPDKYVPESSVKIECVHCKEKDEIIKNLNDYINILKSKRK